MEATSKPSISNNVVSKDTIVASSSTIMTLDMHARPFHHQRNGDLPSTRKIAIDPRRQVLCNLEARVATKTPRCGAR
jgi:hypothetical protein